MGHTYIWQNPKEFAWLIIKMGHTYKWQNPKELVWLSFMVFNATFNNIGILT